MRSLSLVICTLAMAGCMDAPGLGGADDDGENDGLRELVGGVDAKASDLPSTVKFTFPGSYCSAAKVGPNKILTATHCVVGSDGKYYPGLGTQQVWVTSAPDAPTKNNDDFTPITSTDARKGFVKVRITGVYVDPDFAATHGWSGTTDIAVIVVADENVSALAGIPDAQIDYAPVNVGAPVIITGYGCDVGSKTPNSAPSHLKYAVTKTIEDDAADRARYMFTPGIPKGGVASNCPGDSGAPIYGGSAIGAAARIVAVHSAGIQDDKGVNTVNIHTRLSSSWLSKALDDSDKSRFVPIGDGQDRISCLGGYGFVNGAIKEKYVALGGCKAAVGVPWSIEKATPDNIGRYSVFTDGSIYWTKDLGAHEVRSAIRDAWEITGWEKGSLGYPTSDQQSASDGQGTFNTFEKGAIYNSPKSGAHAVYGRIYDKWRELGGLEKSNLGYPTSDEYAVSEGRRTDFERGSLTWVSARNEVTVQTNP